MIGRVFADRYQVAEFIGKGGMALVFRAVDLRTGHDVAVKILRPEFNDDAEFLGRFEREAMAASKMSHHNIVNLLDVGVEGDCRYLVMEYVRGKTLKDVITEKGKLPPAISAQIAIRILSALQHAHSNGIIHRDIKPQNILVHSEGLIKVADFGIARVAGSNTISRVDSVMGSVHYFSPEQARGEDVSAVSDLYSVGIVMYEMLTGHVPFEGDSPVAIAMQHISSVPKPISMFVPDIPTALERVVVRSMEKVPDNRYQSALEMAQDLQRALQEPEGDWLARSQDIPIPLIALKGLDRNNNARTKKNKKKKKLIRILVFLLSVAVVASIGLGSYYIYQQIVNIVKVPYLIGEQEEDVYRIVQEAGLKVEVIRQSDQTAAAGTVIGQSHEYGREMKKGDVILIIVSSGPEEQAIPDLHGINVEDARAMIERIGFSLLVVEKRLSGDKAYTIISQEPVAGSLLSYGGIVQVVVSGGDVVMPSLVGLNREDALFLLQQSGLVLSQIQDVPADDASVFGFVAAQIPSSGEHVIMDTGVTLAVYTAREGSGTPTTDTGTATP
jgi:eukaryotic-like serine/threonine-protein kinase